MGQPNVQDRHRPVFATGGRWATAGIGSVRRRFVVLLLLAAVSLVGSLVLLLGPISQWATPAAGLQGKDLADVRNSTRQILLAAVGGTAILAGLAFTARTYYLTRRGQLTDRYATAISQLASDKITERLGGIYALEHIMTESERDHDTIVEVLAAFIRQSAPANTDNDAPEQDSDPTQGSPRGPTWVPRPTADVRAALTVLCRRPHRPERNRISLECTDLGGADLSGAPLRGVDMHGAQLRFAWLVGAQLQDANLDKAQLTSYLMEAQLESAYLQQAHLQGAQLAGANLRGANLRRAQLQKADLRDTHLQNANLAGADLQDADLAGAQLHGTNFATNILGKPEPIQGITPEQLTKAVLDATTELPDSLRHALDALTFHRDAEKRKRD